MAKPTPEQRIAELERTIKDIAAKLDPQALRSSMEYTWDPRGTEDVPRVVGPGGNTLGKPAPRFQFPGATVAFDPKTRSNIVTTAAGYAGYVFADAGSTAPNSYIAFFAETDPASFRYYVATSTLFAGQRAVIEALSESPGGAAAVFSEQVVKEAGPSSTYSRHASAGAYNSSLQLAARSFGIDYSYAAITATEAGGQNSAVSAFGKDPAVSGTDGNYPVHCGTSALARALVGGTAGGYFGALPRWTQPLVTLYTPDNYAQFTMGVQVTVDDVADTAVVDAVTSVADGSVSWRRTILDEGGRSQYLQTSANTATPDAVRRVSRGPFTAAPGALAAGASATVTVANVRNGTDSVLDGAVKGAAGVEDVVWSWTDGPLANEVTISFKNTGAVSRTAELHFRCTSSS